MEQEVEIPKVSQEIHMKHTSKMETQGKTLDISRFDNVVFSGGGTKGVAFAGALVQLNVSRGIDWGQRCPVLKRVGGVSIGSFFALLIVLGYSVKEIHELVSSMTPESLVHLEFSRVLLEKQVSLDSGNTMRNFLESCIHRKIPGVEASKLSVQDIWSRTGIELCIFATHLDSSTLQKVGLDENLIDGLSASMALPPLLPPILLKSGYYADGGIINNFPLHEFPSNTLGLNLVQRKHDIHSILSSSTPFFAYMVTTLEAVLSSKKLEKEQLSRTITIECGGACGAYDLALSDASRRELKEDGKTAVLNFLSLKN
jgi:NTE family protein